jgi:hypothetical protein
MKRIVRGLEAKLPRQKSPDTSDAPSDSESVKADEIDLGIDVSKGLQRPAKNVLMPDIYGENDDDTQPLLNILDPSSLDTDESTGFNPYDMAVLQKK